MRLGFKQSGIKSTIAVFLDYSQKTEVKAFHCSVCGYVVLQYYDHLKMFVPGEGPRNPEDKPKVTIQCGNNQCKTKYDIYL